VVEDFLDRDKVYVTSVLHVAIDTKADLVHDVVPR